MRRSTVQHNTQQVRTFAIKLDGQGWIGVSAVGDRCRGHGHDTPEQAKLCALHRSSVSRPGQNVVLLPLPEPARPTRRRPARAALPR
jgi:hypothetical protein